MRGSVHFSALFGLAILLTMIIVPLALYRRGSGPSPPDPDPGDDGRGNRPDPPGHPPDGPRGAIPLQDAVPARARLRASGRLAARSPGRSRRPARETERPPVRESEPIADGRRPVHPLPGDDRRTDPQVLIEDDQIGVHAWLDRRRP